MYLFQIIDIINSLPARLQNKIRITRLSYSETVNNCYYQFNADRALVLCFAEHCTSDVQHTIEILSSADEMTATDWTIVSGDLDWVLNRSTVDYTDGYISISIPYADLFNKVEDDLYFFWPLELTKYNINIDGFDDFNIIFRLALYSRPDIVTDIERAMVIADRSMNKAYKAIRK